MQLNARFEVLQAMKSQVVVLLVVTP